jgi:hypothetical protein
MAKPCTRLDVSQKVLGDGYFFFFLLVVFFAFFAFFAFLAMLPSAIPRLIQCKSTLDVHRYSVHHNCKMILRASKKVNGGHTVARCR